MCPLHNLDLDPLSSLVGSQSLSANNNRLFWTEQFNNAIWVKSNATVTPNAGTDPLGGSTADQIADATTTATVIQTSTVAATAGAITSTIVPTAVWTRFPASAVFDTGTYTFSIWLMDPLDLGNDMQVRMDVAGGFIRCYLRDGGGSATFLAWGAKLESGAAATGDETNYGMREAT